MINNLDGGLMISLAVTCDQQCARHRTCDIQCESTLPPPVFRHFPPNGWDFFI